jgi:hypothetical protein
MEKRSFRVKSPTDLMYDVWNRVDDSPACWILLHGVFIPMSFLESVNDMLVNELRTESSSPL